MVTRATAALLPGSETPPLTTPRDAAREAAQRELSKPLYHQNDPSPLQRAIDRFWEWLGDLTGSAADATPGGPVGILVIVVVVVLLIAALWWRLGSPPRRHRRRSPLRRGRPQRRRPPRERRGARRRRTLDRGRPGTHARRRALLEERTLLDPRPGRTADEAAAEAALSLPGHSAELRAAARTFDDVTYGGRTADTGTYARLRDLDVTLERAKPVLTTTGGPAA